MPAIGRQLADVTLLSRAEFRLPALEFPLSLGDGHALASTRGDQVGFELCDHRQCREHELADWVGGVVNGAAQVQCDLTVR